jgi:hypothetical protein
MGKLMNYSNKKKTNNIKNIILNVFKIGLSAVRPYNFHWGKLEKKINVDSDFWAKNLPDNGDKVCVAFDASESYSLNNFNCYSLNNFFCETTSFHLKCLDGFERYKDNCFTFIHSASMNTWYGAKNYCESKNMTLMNVKDKEKFNAVQSYLKKRSTSETRAWVCNLTFYFASYFYDLIE